LPTLTTTAATNIQTTTATSGGNIAQMEETVTTQEYAGLSLLTPLLQIIKLLMAQEQVSFQAISLR
jgi:hypothetical protein